MSEVISWLRKQFDADERAARAATEGPWRYDPGKQWHDGNDFVTMTNPQEYVSHGGPSPFTGCIAITGPANHAQSMNDAAHIARNDPTNALNIIEAHRAIVDEVAYWREKVNRAENYPALGDRYEVAMAILRPLIRAYRHRPGFRTTWLDG